MTHFILSGRVGLGFKFSETENSGRGRQGFSRLMAFMLNAWGWVLCYVKMGRER